jgi:hypothetical protein
VPLLTTGQEKDAGISTSVIKLLQKPRLGSAQLTWRDGRTQKGIIIRVTDQFIAFETTQGPRVCENVGLS